MTLLIISESDRQAEDSQESLHSLVERVLYSNEDLARRLRNLEKTHSTRVSLQERVRSNDRGKEEDGDQEDTPTIVPDKGTQIHPEHSLIRMADSQFAFEEELNSSRVYRRTQLNSTDVSFTSSAVRTTAWSIFSGSSLADISVISVFALPIYLYEISNRQHYGFEESGLAALNINSKKPLYPWSRRSFNLTPAHPGPFRRYAVNTDASKGRHIYLMGGLINGSRIRGDLWMLEVDSRHLSCYHIATNPKGPGPRVGHASLIIGNAFIVFGRDNTTEELDVPDDILYLLNTSKRRFPVIS